MSDRDHLTEDEAARLWQRAAALQAEAASLEEMGSDEDEGSDEDRRAEEESAGSGYALEHVRAAAVEAGIGAEYLDAALVDLKAERVLPNRRKRGVLAKWILPPLPGALTLRRVVEATPAAVLEAMEAVFPHEPYRLSLVERKGNVLEGGVLVFNIEGASAFESEGFRGKAVGADVRQVYVSIRPMDDGGRCEVTLRGPTAWAEARNTGIGAVVVAMTSGAGLAVGGGLGGALATAAAAGGIASIPVAGAIAAAVSVAGVLGGGGAGSAAFRAVYRHALRQGEQGLQDLLSALAVRAQGGWALGVEDADATSLPAERPKLSP